MKRSHRCAIRYAAIELVPITTSGNAHLRYPFTSVSQQKPARNRKHRPPLNSVHAGVQMRFTTGQIPVKCSSSPAATPIAPAASSCRIGIAGADLRSHRPPTNPRIIVPSVGMKLSVKYPPLFATNGFAAGTNSGTTRSNALPKLFSLFQCAAKPEKNPTACAGYNAHASQ